MRAARVLLVACLSLVVAAASASCTGERVRGSGEELPQAFADDQAGRRGHPPCRASPAPEAPKETTEPR
jgi:hypothetical protein